MLMNIPRNLATLAKLCPKDGTARYTALTGIKLVDQGNGLYLAVATNGKLMGMIQGPFNEVDHMGLSACPFTEKDIDDCTDILIDGAEFTRTIGKIKPAKHEADVVLLATADKGNKVGIFGCGTTSQFKTTEGKFPDCNAVFPKGPAMLRVNVDPKLLIQLLTVAAAVNEQMVTLLFYDGTHGWVRKPVGVTATNEHGQAFDGLLVPLSAPDKPTPGEVEDKKMAEAIASNEECEAAVAGTVGV